MFYFAKIFERNIVKKEEKIPKKQLRKKKSRKIKTDKAKYTRSLTLLEQRPGEKLQGHPSFSLIHKPLFNPSQIFSFAALTNPTMEDNHTKKPQNAVVLTTARLPVLPFRRITPLLLPHKLEPHLSQRHRWSRWIWFDWVAVWFTCYAYGYKVRKRRWCCYSKKGKRRELEEKW